MSPLEIPVKVGEFDEDWGVEISYDCYVDKCSI